jgi:DNA-binding transcriptional ArsR family regulator
MTAHQSVLPAANTRQGKDKVQPEAWYIRDEEQNFPDPLLELIAARFRLLGEPLRLKLLAALTTGERTVGELVLLTDAGQANISKHLAALMQGGLVSRRKQGTSSYYAIADTAVIALCNLVCASVQERFAEQVRRLGLHAAGGRVQNQQGTGEDNAERGKGQESHADL